MPFPAMVRLQRWRRALSLHGARSSSSDTLHEPPKISAERCYHVRTTTPQPSQPERLSQAQPRVLPLWTSSGHHGLPLRTPLDAASGVPGVAGRLRSWWRHECQSIRTALTAVTHHSAEKVVAGETNSGPRAQKTVSEGRRPGVLKDPRPPWVEAVTVGYVAASVPSLGVPRLQGEDGVDAHRFLVWDALKTREQVEAAKRASLKKQRKAEALKETEEAKEEEEASSSQRRRIKRKEEEEEEEEGAQIFFLPCLWCADTAMWAGYAWFNGGNLFFRQSTAALLVISHSAV